MLRIIKKQLKRVVWVAKNIYPSLRNPPAKMDEVAAEKYLQAYSQDPRTSPICKNLILQPEYDLTVIIPVYNTETYIAECLYTAISTDTGCFKYSNVSPHTHLCAAELIKAGVDAAEINHRLFDCKSEKMLAAEAVGFQNMKFYHNRKIAAVIFPYDLKEKLELDDGAWSNKENEAFFSNFTDTASELAYREFIESYYDDIVVDEAIIKKYSVKDVTPAYYF